MRKAACPAAFRAAQQTRRMRTPFRLHQKNPIRRLRLLPVLAVLFALLCCQGCGEDEPVYHVDLTKLTDPVVQQPAPALTYAYLPQYSHTVSYERQRLLVAYLTQTTGIPIRQIFPDTFDEHLNMFRRGEIDISFSNPLVYVKLQEMGAQAFARIIEPSGRPFFKGQIICRAENKALRSLQDCKGKSWMAVDPASAGGYLFPLGLFYANGVSLKDFKEVMFAPGPGGKQEKVVLSVYAGAYDIGTIREGTLALMQQRIDMRHIRVLAETPAYPSWVYSSRQGLDSAVRAAIAQAMFRLSPDNPQDRPILESARIRGIIPSRDADFDSVRTLLDELRNQGVVR